MSLGSSSVERCVADNRKADVRKIVEQLLKHALDPGVVANIPGTTG